MHIWAQAVGVAGDPYDFDKVNALHQGDPVPRCLRRVHFNRTGLTCIPYPDDTADPSIGMPHLTFQIQDGQQKIISPEPYTTGKFQVPSWLQ